MHFHNAQLKYFNSKENSIELEPKFSKCIIKKHLLRGLANEQIRIVDCATRSGRRHDRFRRARACYNLTDRSVDALQAESLSRCRSVVVVHCFVDAARSSFRVCILFRRDYHSVARRFSRACSAGVLLRRDCSSVDMSFSRLELSVSPVVLRRASRV